MAIRDSRDSIARSSENYGCRLSRDVGENRHRNVTSEWLKAKIYDGCCRETPRSAGRRCAICWTSQRRWWHQSKRSGQGRMGRTTACLAEYGWSMGRMTLHAEMDLDNLHHGFASWTWPAGRKSAGDPCLRTADGCGILDRWRNQLLVAKVQEQ